MPVLMRPWGHMHYRDTGYGTGVPALALNSLGTDLRMWDGVAARLPGLRWVGLDKRGHGLSATPAGDWTLDDLAADALALMDHLHIDRAVIAGCSIGGMIAQAMACTAPDRVAGLFLSNTAMKVGTPDTWAARIDGVMRLGLKGMAGQIMDRWFAEDFRASDAARPWETLLRNGDDAGYVATCRVLAGADLRDRSPAITCPALLIGGTADLSTPPDLIRATAAAIPGAQVQILDGSGHIPAIDNPAALSALLAAFHRSLPDVDTGMTIRRQILGDAHVDRAVAATTPFDAPFQDLITQSAWARVWGRGTLPLRERSMLTIALLAGLGNDHELALHIRATARTGTTEADIMEALLHVAIYAGVPRANHAIRIARETFDSMKAAS